MSGLPCRCGCVDPSGAAVHEVAIALSVDDLDRAIEAGLLLSSPCRSCEPGCTASVLAARDARREALAARERFRTREARLQRIATERASRRATPSRAPASDTAPLRPALPPAAAAALARAKARAAKH